MKILRNHYVLAVRDLEVSAGYFVDVLGFSVVMEPPGWVFVKRDDVMVMMGHCPDDREASELRNHSYFGYLVVDDVDAYHAEVAARSKVPVAAPVTKPWDMREFALTTPEGHRIMVGQVMETRDGRDPD